MPEDKEKADHPTHPSPWMTRAEAAEFLRCSVDTIDRSRVLWTERKPQPGRYRYKLFAFGLSKSPRILAEDVFNSAITP